MALFFTSDTHFGHAAVIGFYRRPFRSVAEMDAALIRLWNETVSPADEVWHLGDFAIKQSPARMKEVLGALAGTKRLVRGNNDPDETAALAGWAEVTERKDVVLDGLRLIAAHHPLPRLPERTINLHGHSHGRRKPRPGYIDVGVDVWDYRPIPWAALRKTLAGEGTIRSNSGNPRRSP